MNNNYYKNTNKEIVKQNFINFCPLQVAMTKSTTTVQTGAFNITIPFRNDSKPISNNLGFEWGFNIWPYFGQVFAYATEYNYSIENLGGDFSIYLNLLDVNSHVVKSCSMTGSINVTYKLNENRNYTNPIMFEDDRRAQLNTKINESVFDNFGFVNDIYSFNWHGNYPITLNYLSLYIYYYLNPFYVASGSV